MHYFVTTSSFHTSIVQGIHIADASVKLIAVPRQLNLRGAAVLAHALARIILDHRAHVYIAHPCSGWFTLFASVARTLSLYDDGIAYYARSPLPKGTRQKIYAWLSRRWFDWTAINQRAKPSYGDLLIETKAEDFWALYPEIIPECPIPVKKVNASVIFDANSHSKDGQGIALFLDTGSDIIGPDAYDRVFELLRRLATQRTDGVIHYRTHPNRPSTFGARLSEADWARELDVPPEEFIKSKTIDELYSFYSSASISVHLAQESTRIYVLDCPDDFSASESLLILFNHLGAAHVRI